jgi:hypothetical protein
MLSREERREEAERNADAARRRVDRQRRLIADLQADGHDMETAQHLLLAFERTQAMFEQELAAVLKEQTALENPSAVSPMKYPEGYS